MKAAVIDIGSGSVRLLLGGNKTTIMTKLSEGLHESHNLSEEAMTRTTAAIKAFVAEAQSAGAEVYAFATEAVRAAENRSEFINKVKDECDVSIEVISGYEEAEIALLGAVPNGVATVIDIGGASVEIISGSAGARNYELSLPLGMVRLTEKANGSPDLMRVLAARGITGYGEVPVLEQIIGVGGTFTSLAAMSMGLTSYDPKRVQGYVLSKREVDRLVDELISLGDPKAISAQYPVLLMTRAELITAGAIFVSELMSYLNITAITVSEADNLDGYVRYKNLEV